MASNARESALSQSEKGSDEIVKPFGLAGYYQAVKQLFHITV